MLAQFRESARSGKGNLLDLSVKAAAARATVGEISGALEEEWGRHKPKDQIVRGAYRKTSTEDAGEAGKNGQHAECIAGSAVCHKHPRLRDFDCVRIRNILWLEREIRRGTARHVRTGSESAFRY